MCRNILKCCKKYIYFNLIISFIISNLVKKKYDLAYDRINDRCVS